jgi:phenylalanyl-tRNA synthetase beta chain
VKDEAFAFGTECRNTNDENIVRFGQLRQELCAHFEIAQPVFYADFNWQLLLETTRKNKIRFEEPARFPGIRRDLALVVDQPVSYASIRQLAKRKGGKLLQEVNLFDVFESEEKLGAGKKSYAVSFHFLDRTKTLSDKEVDKTMAALVAAFETEMQAQVRK